MTSARPRTCSRPRKLSVLSLWQPRSAGREYLCSPNSAYTRRSRIAPRGGLNQCSEARMPLSFGLLDFRVDTVAGCRVCYSGRRNPPGGLVPRRPGAFIHQRRIKPPTFIRDLRIAFRHARPADNAMIAAVVLHLPCPIREALCVRGPRDHESGPRRSLLLESSSFSERCQQWIVIFGHKPQPPLPSLVHSSIVN